MSSASSSAASAISFVQDDTPYAPFFVGKGHEDRTRHKVLLSIQSVYATHAGTTQAMIQYASQLATRKAALARITRALNTLQDERDGMSPPATNSQYTYVMPTAPQQAELRSFLTDANYVNSQLPPSLCFPGQIDLTNFDRLERSLVPMTRDSMDIKFWVDMSLENERNRIELGKLLEHGGLMIDRRKREKKQREILERLQESEVYSEQLRRQITDILVLTTTGATLRGHPDGSVLS